MADKSTNALAKQLADKSPAEMKQIAIFLREQGMLEEAERIESQLAAKTDPTERWLNQLITQDKDMTETKERIRTLAKHPDTVLLIGESGTGKEILAQALHGQRAGQFVSINCAGLPEHLIESELFGHARGAFTDAKEIKLGLFAVANNGTLFLDEIGELPMPLQAKLLRAIQFRRIRKVGSLVDESINCRFVCATHHTLRELIEHNRFRLDLYYRIATFELQTKAIRYRQADIPLIIRSLLPADRQNDTSVQAVMSRLKLNELYGNVRELQSIIRRYVVLG